MSYRLRTFFGLGNRHAENLHVALMAELSDEDKNKLSDSEFAFVDKDGGKHLPVNDAEHVRDAEARFDQEQFPDEAAKRGAWEKIEAAAKTHGVELHKQLGDNGQLVDKGKSATASTERFASQVCFAALPEDGSVPEWIEILPLGEFSTNANDPRGPFQADAAKVIAASKARMSSTGLPIDYDHRTFIEGNPDSRAAGWIKDFRAVGRTLQARVEWTEAAKKAIAAKEFRFISPVFKCQPNDPDAPKDEVSGRVLYIRGAGLTNDPALTMTAILSAPRTTMKGKTLKMSEICASLEKAFPSHSPKQIQELAAHAYSMQDADGGEADGGDDADAGAMSSDADAGETEAAAQERHASMAAERTAKNIVETPADQAAREAREATEITAAHTRDVERAATRGTRVVRMTAAVAKDPTVVAMAKRLGDLEQERALEKAQGTVNQALKDRKITPANKEWALAYCKADPTGFATYLKNEPVKIADQDGGFRGLPPSHGADTVLSAADEGVCAMFGHDRKKFAENKKAFMAGTFVPKAVRIIDDSASA